MRNLGAIYCRSFIFFKTKEFIFFISNVVYRFYFINDERDWCEEWQNFWHNRNLFWSGTFNL